MIVLDQGSSHYLEEFSRYKTPPTHARIVMMRWSLPEDAFTTHDAGYSLMLRRHIEAIYVFGRLNEDSEFTQTPEDTKFMPAHAGVDMTEYEVEPNIGTHGLVLDSPERQQLQAFWKRQMAIRDTLIAHLEGPHIDDPTQRVPSQEPRNRFSEHDLDIVFSHTDRRLRGRAVK